MTTPAVVIGLLLLGACLVSVWYINRPQANLARILSQNVRSLEAAQDLEIRVRQLRFHCLVYLIEPTPARLSPIEADHQGFEASLRMAGESLASQPAETAADIAFATQGRPFLAINCAALAETLLENELFGHEQGAFTGADRRRIGKFEQCDGGTLFVDEIGDMSAALQSKMLRVLQEQRFERLGSNETIQTRVRVLAATNHNLERAVEEGRFRKDLYYRLNVVTIRVPPLRVRPGDVAELAHYFLFRFDR